MAGYAIVVLLGGGVLALLGVTVPVGVVMIVAAAMLVRGEVPLTPAFRLREWGRLLAASAAFVLATAVGTIYLFTAQILTAAVTDAHDTGLFAASFRIFVVLAAVPGLLITVAFPLLSRAARDDRDRLAYAVQRLVEPRAVLGPAATIVLVVGAPAILRSWPARISWMPRPPCESRGQRYSPPSSSRRSASRCCRSRTSRHPRGQRPGLRGDLAAVAGLAAPLGPEGAAIGTVIGEWTLALGYLMALRRASPETMPNFGRPARALAAAAPCLLFALASHPVGPRRRVRSGGLRAARSRGARGPGGTARAASAPQTTPMTPLRVGLNLVPIGQRAGGVGSYATELTAALAARDDVELHLFVSRDAPRRSCPRAARACEGHAPAGAAVRTAASTSRLSSAPSRRFALVRRLDLVHSPANAGPVRIPGVASVITLHDTTWARAGGDWGSPAAVRSMYRVALPPPGARTGSSSERSTPRTTSSCSGLPPDRIDVAHHGVRVDPEAPATSEAELRGGSASGPTRWCSAWRRSARTRIRRLSCARSRDRLAGVRLVLPGAPTPYERRLAEARRRNSGWRIGSTCPAGSRTRTSRVSTAWPPASRFPSRLEGFGLPVLEAMARGLPVACSDRTALPEVAGDAALLFDPDEPEAVAGALDRLLRDADLRQELAARGSSRAAQFTWAAAAEATVASYRRALAH